MNQKEISNYMSKIGRKGGKKIYEQRGPDYYRELQKKSTQKKKLAKKAKK